MKKHLKKYFIPNDDNDHQPHSLRDKSLRNILVVSIVFELIALVLILPVFNGKLDYLSAVLPSVLVSETNKTRSDQNLGTLETNDLLVAAAQMKANDMAEKGYFAHVTPDGKQPWYFLTQAGYKYEVAGENLAVNFVDSKQVHKAWMDSPTHKANILKDKYTEVGIATAKGTYKGEEAIFVAQFFGKPKLVVENIPRIVEPQIVETKQSEPVILESEVAGANIETDIQVEDDTNFIEFGIDNEQNTEEDFKPVLSNVSNDPNGSDGVKNITTQPIEFSKGILEQAVSSPVTSVGFILSILLLLVSIALMLKVLIKIKIQYPKMILNGALVMSVLGLFYILNSVLVDIFGEVL